jgi:hypothetical protein
MAVASARSGGLRAVETTGFFPTVKSSFLLGARTDVVSSIGNGFLVFSSLSLFDDYFFVLLK